MRALMPLIVHAPGGSQWVCRRARVSLGALILRCDESSWSINVSSAELSIHSFVQIIVQPGSDESSRSRSLVSAMLKNWLKPANAPSIGRNAKPVCVDPANNTRLLRMITRHPDYPSLAQCYSICPCIVPTPTEASSFSWLAG